MAQHYPLCGFVDKGGPKRLKPDMASGVWVCAPAGEFCEERAARTALQNICWNNCQGRGECRRGFCHCQPGFWGKDCSSSKVYAPHAARRPVHKLRVYVYDLPWTVSTLLLLCCRT